ncbi:uncharacterized protein ATNIH1004_006888 [Aspergillus tanneri]|uniref:Alcohol dehydrogenase-like N-terminal domain-containing protein n=1 Tax=Aspergillus tanneri TaxID=1220188 RepID=A0A5M9MLZ1_9EURO|nr:uncharacterized protein ATNIH1004_006888 [Aspergillus tanneri]KAA8645469.1 hypothetical protein ATNIH1004_006888 [Aspergillus tanneri]
MNNQQALILKEVQRSLVLDERPIPQSEGNQVLVRIIATGINPHDQKKYLPYAILTNDISGIVEKIGPEAQRFSIGDRIFGQWHILSGGPDQAGLQQFCILDADSAAPISSHHSFGQAVMFPINAIASFIALFDPSGSGLTPIFLG